MGRVFDYLLGRDVKSRQAPEGTLEQQFARFWSENITGASQTAFFSPRLVERVWVANRCIQLNAQQIAGMPLRFQPGSATSTEPAWTSSPDPVWYPNGVSDAVFAAVRSIYGWGDAFLFITGRYASGFPSAWTVMDPATVNVQMGERGRKEYEVNGEPVDRDDVVQISRDPGGGLRGTSALSSYASQAWSVIAAGNLETNVLTGGTIPHAVLKSTRKLNEGQARTIQDAWVTARARYGSGVPAILPPDLDLQDFANIPPKDLLLLEAQEFDARVVATAYGVPASLLNMAVSGGLTYQNPQTLGEQWWRFELRPTAKRVADALTANMLPRGSSVTFDASDTFAALTEASDDDDPQASQVAQASPADENVRPLRPAQEGNA